MDEITHLYYDIGLFKLSLYFRERKRKTFILSNNMFMLVTAATVFMYFIFKNSLPWFISLPGMAAGTILFVIYVRENALSRSIIQDSRQTANDVFSLRPLLQIVFALCILLVIYNTLMNRSI